MSWKPEVKVSGSWYPNGLVFETKQEAEASARNVCDRWALAEDSRAVESTKTPNYTWRDGVLSRIEPSPVPVEEPDGVATDSA